MDEYNVVIDALQTKLDAIEKMQRGCDNINSSIGGGMGLMDCIRYEQMDELRQAIKREQALSYVNETPKNKHDSDDVLNKAGNVNMMREALQALYDVQNGPPLEKYRYAWNLAMVLAEQALAAKPAPFVRLTDDDVMDAYSESSLDVNARLDDLFDFANVLQDAWIKKNRGQQ